MRCDDSAVPAQIESPARVYPSPAHFVPIFFEAMDLGLVFERLRNTLLLHYSWGTHLIL
jgi:hypothetical protein